MKKLITAATATYAIVLMFGGYASNTAIPTSSIQALNNDKKCSHVVTSFNDGYVFADYITGCDSPITSADKPQQNQIYPESATTTDLVYVPTTGSSASSCNSPSNLDSRGHRCGGRVTDVKTSRGRGHR